MADSQTLDDYEKSAKHGGLFNTSLGGVIRLKSMLFLFILYIIISTDVFTHHVLKHIPNTTSPTGEIMFRGVIVQGIMLVLLFVIVDLLVSFELI